MKKLKQKMVLTAFLSMAVVFIAVLGILDVSLSIYNTSQADGMTNIISINDGVVPRLQEFVLENFQDRLSFEIRFNEESAFRTRYFIVYLDENMQPYDANIDHVAAVDRDAAFEMAWQALSGGDTVGYIDEYRFRVAESDEADMVIFLDCSESLSFIRVVISIVMLTSVLFTALVTLIFAGVSGRVLRPFEENSQRQKQFITDASHELKTPLSIISANAELLEFKDGGSEWTKNIIDQTKRMNKLISDMLVLSKAEEIVDAPMETVDLSTVAAETAESFRELAGRKNAELKISVPDGITVRGNPEQLRRLVSILMENAAKYVSEGGEIALSLETSGKSAVLKIYNTAELGADFNCKRLFDRFYRPDSSRSSETGGHGIGLSIAKKIASQHSGTLSAKQVRDGICFTAVLPCGLKKL